MKMLFWIVAVVVLLVLLFAVWVRVAPTDAAQWHRMPDSIPQSGSETGLNSHIAVVRTADQTKIDRLFEAMGSTDRTVIIAGSREDHLVTYETRSKLMGYPDYTTVRLDRVAGEAPIWEIVLYARSRFGKGDMGVNKKRVDGWLRQAGLSEGA